MVNSRVVSSLVVNSPMTEGPVVISFLIRILRLAGLCVSVQKMSV